ncbi:hypothetical protein [uncultured Campylobacter sp.]|uniref:hypothetical protein n=1 Tax=uncultured Campylobacter sp. TaxID=218934 RepID=UPI003211C004
MMEIPSSAYNAEIGQTAYDINKTYTVKEGWQSGKDNYSSDTDDRPMAMDHSNSYFKNLDGAQDKEKSSTTPPNSELKHINSPISSVFKDALPDGLVENNKINGLTSKAKHVGDELFYKEYIKDYQDKFDYQDGWFISKDKSTIIGSDKAKKLAIVGKDTDTSGYDDSYTIVRVGDKAPSVFGSDKADNITVDGAKVKMISTGTGDDTINVKNGAEILTNINSGSGNDTINVEGKDTVINGQEITDEKGNKLRVGGIMTGDGDDTINVTNKAEVKAGIYDGNGNDKINASGGATVGGKDSAEAQQQRHAGIQLGDGKNTVTIEGEDTTVSRVTGYKYGEDKNGVQFETENNVTVKDKATVSFDIDIDNRNADKVTIENATVKGTIFTNGGSDTINVTGSKVGGVLGEGGNDIINVSKSEIGGEGSFYGDMQNEATGKFDRDGNDNVKRVSYRGVSGDQLEKEYGQHWKHGDDLINISNSTIHGQVRGGRGEQDIINIDNSKVEGSVFGDSWNRPTGDEGSKDGKDIINITNKSVIEGIIDGEGGDDIITVNNSTVNGRAAKDYKGNDIKEAIVGGKGDDKVFVQNESNVKGNISGDQGSNIIAVEGGSKVAGWVYGANAKTADMYNETGNNTITVTGENTEVSRVGDVSSGNSTITISDKAKVKSVHGDRGVDTIMVDNATVTEKIEGGHGDDKIYVRNGARVEGYVTGDLDNDTIEVSGENTYVKEVKGDKGNDTINVLDGATIGGNIEGNNGADTINIEKSTIKGKIQGDAGNDTIKVSDSMIEKNEIRGGDGDDTIIIGAGNKWSTEHKGNLAINGDAGNDTTILKDGITDNGLWTTNESRVSITNNDGNIVITKIDKSDTVDLSKLAAAVDNDLKSVDITSVNGGKLNITAQDILDINKATGSILTIKGGSDDTIHNTDGSTWKKNSDGTYSTTVTENETTHTVTIKIEDSITPDL